jgi:hypothetical protein
VCTLTLRWLIIYYEFIDELRDLTEGILVKVINLNLYSIILKVRNGLWKQSLNVFDHLSETLICEFLDLLNEFHLPLDGDTSISLTSYITYSSSSSSPSDFSSAEAYGFFLPSALDLGAIGFLGAGGGASY